jgi:Tfp pilus assembly protein PilN
MSTDMFPPESGFTAQMPAPQQDPLRMVRISASLLPDEILDGRRIRRTRTAVVSGLGAVVLLLAGWYGSTFVQAGSADEELARSEAQIAAAQQEQGKYRELTDTKTRLNAAADQLSSLMTTDTQWQKLLSDLRGAAPTDVQIGQLTAAISGAGGGQDGLPSQTAEALVGTVTITGKAKSKDQIAEFVENVRRVTGLANPLPTDVSSQAGQESFSMRLDITQAALGGRFTPDPAETPATAPATGGK